MTPASSRRACTAGVTAKQEPSSRCFFFGRLMNKRIVGKRSSNQQSAHAQEIVSFSACNSALKSWHRKNSVNAPSALPRSGRSGNFWKRLVRRRCRPTFTASRTCMTVNAIKPSSRSGLDRQRLRLQACTSRRAYSMSVARQVQTLLTSLCTSDSEHSLLSAAKNYRRSICTLRPSN